MNFEEVKELIGLVDSSNLAFFEMSFEDSHIKMDKSLSRNEGIAEAAPTAAAMPVMPVAAPAVSKFTAAPAAKKEEKAEIKPLAEEVSAPAPAAENLKEITSPMVGTFYSASSPEADPFVKAGDKVTKGKVICIIEAMKLMNEIESEFDGEIAECLVKDGDMVEYGQPLFKIKED